MSLTPIFDEVCNDLDYMPLLTLNYVWSERDGYVTS